MQKYAFKFLIKAGGECAQGFHAHPILFITSADYLHTPQPPCLPPVPPPPKYVTEAKR